VGEDRTTIELFRSVVVSEGDRMGGLNAWLDARVISVGGGGGGGVEMQSDWVGGF
jgi:hypothetical protein